MLFTFFVFPGFKKSPYKTNLLLKAGCALLVAADDGTVYLSRIVTTYKHNAMGENDVSYRFPRVQKEPL